MKLALLFALTCSAACGTSADERPATFEVVTLEVLKPMCGQVQCHSTTTKIEGLAFDTLDAARTSLREQGVGEILEVILDKEMPPDQPMADEDVELLERWIDANTPGL